MRRLAALAAGKLACYLEKERKEGLVVQYQDFLPQGITEAELEEWEAEFFQDIAVELEKKEETKEKKEPEKKHWEKLLLILKPIDLPGKIAWTCLELAVLYTMERRVSSLLEQLCLGTKAGVTIELAGKLVCGERETLTYFKELREAYQRVELLLQADYPIRNFLTATLQADNRLLDWLSGGDDLTLISPHFLTWHIPNNLQDVPIFHTKVVQELLQQVSCLTNKENASVVFLTGERLSGRKFLLKHLADRYGFHLLMADAAFFGNLDSLLLQLRKLLREILLGFGSVVLCITGIPKRVDTKSFFLILEQEYQAIWKYLQKLEIGITIPPLLLSGEAGLKAAPILDVPVIAAELTLPGMEEGAAAWDYFANHYLGEHFLQSRELAIKMRLPIGRIEQVVKRLAMLPAREIYESKTVFRYCYELLDDGRYDNIKRVKANATYEDLKLEKSQKEIIRAICAQVEYRRKVLDEWNLNSRYSYGTCVSALFTGPPGTGKTMAVHVMASMLGLELFKVDLSQLVDKYIGETEKRLEEVFQKAERSNLILFFDEADAIIGKRSEVKEAKDKYANTEVSYLLQRMEEFDGIVILSSNYSQNIDAAFMRRIRFTVHFPIPDEATRKEIWQSAFAKEVPQEELDFDYLSRQFEFTGGQIKNIVWNAAFFAASEESAVAMRHLIRAIQLELTKDKKVSFQEVLGEYGHLLYQV